MIRLERVDRITFFKGMTPGWTLGVICYVVGVLALFFWSKYSGKDLAPCLLRQSTGLACPLCGGTTAAVHLASGNPVAAIAKNPGVAIGLPLAAIWMLLYAGFGIVVRLSLPKPVLVSLLVAVVVANWAYVISTR